MQLYPTRATFHVAVAGLGLVTLGATARLAPVVAFGGAMILAVAVGRAIAQINIARLRAAGFEMVWADTSRVHRVTRGSSIVLRGELRNRSDAPARASRIRAIVSSMLEASVDPACVDLPPGARATVEVTLHARRVGRWGVHGLALEVCGTPFFAEGLYEVPLLFANPLGVEVFPAQLGTLLSSPRGGRSRRAAEAGSAATAAGRGDELRELRDHVPGDPFKRIAWKASARRGRLLVREMEREERDVVWLVVDSSVELWAGTPGQAPLDRVVDDAGAEAARHLRRGDRVGLVVTASRLRSWVAPEVGAAHAHALAAALASAANVIDVDRSELDEAEVARLVAEHARPLDPQGLADVPGRSLDALAERAEQLRANAPFATRVPFAPTARDRTLRHYLASFGVETPPRIDGERERTEPTLARVLDRFATEKPHPSIVHIWAPAPRHWAGMAKPVAALRRRGVDSRWTLPAFEAGLEGEDVAGRGAALADVVDEAVRIRARASRAKGERALRRLGVRVMLPSGRAGPPARPAREGAS